MPTPVKRKGSFSFDYADIMRVNNVRNAWKINCPGREDKRQFYDRRAHASVVCVLVGTYTWSRPWVRYEIARPIIDKKGLLAFHINGLAHHTRRLADAHAGLRGHWLPEARSLLPLRKGAAEGGAVWSDDLGEAVEKYNKFTLPVPLPKYMQALSEGWVQPLSGVTPIYDYVGHEGHKNIGKWIDTAALRVSR
ncbi:TIR domain-containing protein [Bradyrhizobium zhanjiangense]|uniref:TIR domain-containing protein n=1 Tax=Bradyrhizobium zhanjiangense TaxID=1325107 RepID=UPI00100930E2|nr:TIR domain-containing protein [Bradyrhizobium zhanjiangense]